ncbi:MAG: ABC transporter ATP-binding protein [Anaerolineae bacterium]
MMDNAIEIDGLRKRYGKLEALKGVGMHVQRGEIFGLVGANGAGKSTLIQILVGALRYNEGSVSVLGLNPMKQARALRHQLGYMPQAPALYEDLSARDNVRFFGRAHGIKKLEARVDEVLEFTLLRDREKDPVYEFSGGMKQRVSLACTLVHNPKLLLLDEATAGVDPKLREAFWKHCAELAEQGATILVSTHQMDEVLHCDRVAVMREGVVLACDTPRGLLARGAARVRVWNGAEAVNESVANYPEQLPRILQRFQLDPSISRIEVIEDTLEDIVLNLINAKEISHA